MILWYDSFSRANQSGFGSPNTPPGGAYSLVRGSQGLSIASNEGVVSFVSSTTAGVVQAGSQLIGDSEMLCRVSQGGSTSDLVGVVPRFIDSNNWYTFCIGDTAGQFQLIKDVSGTFTVISPSFAFPTTVGSFYWIRARVQGTHFLGKIWADGTAEPSTWGIDTTDASLTAHGTFGLTCAPQSGNNVRVDSFYVIDSLNSEALVLSDAFTDGVSSLPVESLTITDSQTIASATLPTEALSVTDRMAIGLASSAVEALSVTDQLSTTATAACSDQLATVDQVVNNASVTVIEALVLADSVWGNSLFALIEALVVSDAWVAAGQASFVEGLTLLDLWDISNIIIVPPPINVTMQARKGTITLIGRKGTITLYGRKN